MTTVAFRAGREVCECDVIEMCEWLDHHRFDPSPFFWDVIDNERALCVDFDSDAEAHAFAEAFGGEILTGGARRTAFPA